MSVLRDEGQKRDVQHSWSESERFVPRTFIRPAQRFMQVESSSAVAMLVAALLAFGWANSPWSAGYTTLWSTPVDLGVGSFQQLSGLTLRDWVNDAGMTLFFMLVALEIKRELVSGQLRDRRAAALPVIAALGGMIVPAAIYLSLNIGTPGAHGWGVPMATDIAFAVAVVALAGPRVPSGAKLLLLTLAIADDLGAIIVIAVFYTNGLSLTWLALAVGTLVAAIGLRRLDVRSLLPFALLGIVCWFALHESGVHTTLTGVAFGFLTPTWSFYDPARFGTAARELVDDVETSFADERFEVGEYERTQSALYDLQRLTVETTAPLERLVHRLTPWVSFVIVPVFAFANAGVAVPGASVGLWAQDPVLLGVFLGLVLGKTIGVFSAVWLTCRLTLVRLPTGTTWRHIFGLSVCAGIGFTVALFITDLSSPDPAIVQSAKTGVLLGSLVAGTLGYLILRSCPVEAWPDDEVNWPGTPPR